MKSLIIVSNRLPVTVSETIEKSSGGLVSAIEGLEDKFNIRWVGWAGGVVEDPERKKQITDELKERFNYTPLFLSRQEIDEYYTGFSNSSLWPLLHYMPSNARFKEPWFEQYRRVNRLFADKVIEQCGVEDIVWIQDYHLMLLPSMLRERRPDMTIGFFLHTPFPSYEIFRCHPKREELLKGLLGADLIGFHTYGYLRHFRSTVLRILGYESELDYVTTENRRCGIDVYPIGINSTKFRTFLDSENFEEQMSDLKSVYQGKKIVLSVERLDYSKGIPQRLEAIDMFLEETDRKDVVFLFISVPSRQNVLEYRQLRKEVELKVSQINGKHSSIGEVPVHFIFRSVSFEELCSLYCLADVATVTSLIDGMNLVAKEYLFCQTETPGALVLSEFAGAAQELSHAYIVNPYYVRQISDAIKKALDASDEEKWRRVRPMKERVAKYDARFWAGSFISGLTRICDNIPCPVRSPELTTESVSQLHRVRKPVLFLDYDGTLAELKRLPVDAAPSGEVEEMLFFLSRQKRFHVYLLSGRKREEMDQWFSRFGLGLVAEHGYCYREKDADQWVVMAPGINLPWKDNLRELLNLHTDMTPGSFIEEKSASLVWHYGNSDPELGARKAHQLVSELQETHSNIPVKVYHGKKVVVIASVHADKGAVVSHLMAKNDYDFAMCLGDDETDEDMFRLSDERIVGVKIGDDKTTEADFRCASPKALRSFFENLLAESFLERPLEGTS